MTLLRRLWDDDSGFVLSLELLLVWSILILGLAGGLIELRSAMLDQFAAMATSIRQLNVGYQVPAVWSTTGTSNSTIVNVETTFFLSP